MLTQEEFILRAKKTHGNKYNYSKVEYKNTNTKVEIICPKHGSFWQLPSNHMKNVGCPNCSKNKKFTQEEFIQRAKKVHGDKYDYSKVEYKNCMEKVEIICSIHGSFWQTPDNHVRNKQNCPKCIGKNKTKEELIKQLNKIHNNKYDYSLIDYKSTFDKIVIICPKHGKFSQRLTNHLQKNGCPKCKESKNESKIRNFLEKKDIVFEQQKRFPTCKYKKPLPFDFYVPSKNLLIEYQGELHYTTTVDPRYHHNEKQLKLHQTRDSIKKQWALNNDYNFLEIKYNENIEEKLLNII